MLPVLYYCSSCLCVSSLAVRANSRDPSFPAFSWTHTRIQNRKWRDCCARRVSFHLKCCVPLSCLHTVFSCPPRTSSFLFFSSSHVLPLPSWWKTLSASLPTSLQASYFTGCTFLFLGLFSLSLSVRLSISFQWQTEHLSEIHPFLSFQRAVSSAVKPASVRSTSLPSASTIGHYEATLTHTHKAWILAGYLRDSTCNFSPIILLFFHCLLEVINSQLRDCMKIISPGDGGQKGVFVFCFLSWPIFIFYFILLFWYLR